MYWAVEVIGLLFHKGFNLRRFCGSSTSYGRKPSLAEILLLKHDCIKRVLQRADQTLKECIYLCTAAEGLLLPVLDDRRVGHGTGHQPPGTRVLTPKRNGKPSLNKVLQVTEDHLKVAVRIPSHLSPSSGSLERRCQGSKFSPLDTASQFSSPAFLNALPYI